MFSLTLMNALNMSNDLSVLIKFLVDKFRAMPQFRGELKDSCTDQCRNNGLQINIKKTKVMCFNPFEMDVACPESWFPTISTAIILCVTFSTDCYFSYHISNLVKKGNSALRSLTTLRRPSESVTISVYLLYTPLLEYASPVWGPQVHNIDDLSADLEAVQKRVAKIILDPKYDNIRLIRQKIVA